MKKTLIILFLLFMGSIIYFKWFSFAPFVNGDWGFLFKQSLISNFFPSIWTTGFGDINIILWRYPFDFLNGIFGYLGFDSNVAEKFLYFWPIIFIAPVSSFLLVKKITKSNLAGFIGSLIFSYNTYFLSIDTAGHELLTIAFSWAVFAILSFVYLMETKKRIFIPLTALLLFIVGSYDLRSLYITAGALVFYAGYHQLIIEQSWRKSLLANVLNSFLSFFVLLLLNLYWILPCIFAKTLTSNAILSRAILEGNFYNLQSATVLFYPFWTGAVTTWFFVQKIPFTFWLYPILAFAGLAVGRKNKQIVFFGLLAVIGIFLTKQNAPPFSVVYTFLYSYVPGFSAFREASKFYFLIAISYAVLIGVFAFSVWNYLKNAKYAKYFLIFLIALLPLWNTAPLLSGWIGTLFVPKVIPSNLKSVSSYLSVQNKYSKIFWINRDISWVFSTNSHPLVDGSVGKIEAWANQAKINLNYLNLNSDQQLDNQKMLRFIKSDVGRRMLSIGSFGYLVVSEESNDFTGPNSSAWRSFGGLLKNIRYLKQVSNGIPNTLLFKNQEQRPHVDLTLEKENIKKDVAYKQVDFRELGPSEYSINANNIKEPFYLNFSDNFNPNWKLYVGQFNLLNVVLNKQQVVNDKNHFQNVVGFNSFYVDSTQVCKGDGGCIKNKDGSYDIALTLFFKPQAYLYFGLIISLVTLLGSISAVIYFYKRKI